jgi:hypothetical protein
MPRLPRIRCALTTLFVGVVVLSACQASAASWVKDIVQFEGVRENMLVGYGLAAGLRGAGDALRNSPSTRQSLAAMLERMGVNTRETSLNTKNVAAVMVTARLPDFAPSGSSADVTVSAMGDAKSLLAALVTGGSVPFRARLTQVYTRVDAALAKHLTGHSSARTRVRGALRRRQGICEGGVQRLLAMRAISSPRRVQAA